MKRKRTLGFEEWEEYFKKYEKWLKDVRKETFSFFSVETEAVIFPISDSTEFYPRTQIEWEQSLHSFLGILRNYLWKATNWISFEVLTGKYFEAMRNMRFLFEWSVLGIAMEDVIEGEMWDRYKSLSEIGLKLDILEILKSIPFKMRRAIQNENQRLKIINKAIGRYFKKLEKEKKLKELTKQEMKEFIRLYASILSDKRWWDYSAILKIIDEYLAREDFLKATSRERQKLKDVWCTLCEYSHFPGNILNDLVDDPTFIFIEKANKNLFEKCFKTYFTVLDLCYASILWRFPTSHLQNRVKNLVNLWKRDFNISFSLTRKLLKKYER